MILLLSSAARAQMFTTLAAFSNASGTNPYAGLVLSADGSTLYGVTPYGGAYNHGTVFSLSVSGGGLTALASFNGTDGSDPSYASLILNGSTLYGTTASGGANGRGTVFSLPTSGGSPTVLASFNYFTNGASPYARLLLSGSTLYGTTDIGGANGDGTVFSLPISGGSPTVLASNGVNCAYPSASLLLSGSTFYGTAQGVNGAGAVFSLPASGGTPTVLAAFSNRAYPCSDLVLSGSTLYGTTEEGGANGDGTVFSLPVGGGTANTLLTFNSSNGANPRAGLLLSGSKLYGTTENGGINGSGGVIFSMNTDNGSDYEQLHEFGGTDGSGPVCDLIIYDSTLYGTTSGGTGPDLYGTVFALNLAPTPEPSTLALVGAGAIGLLGYQMRLRKRRAARPSISGENGIQATLSFSSRLPEATRRAA